MSETEIIHEEPNIPDTPITSEEDKFFGKTTEVDNSIVEGLEVEVVDDTPEEDRGKPKRDENVPPQIPDDDEIKSYSGDVQKRIKQLKYEYHEERRAKEAAVRESQEAVQLSLIHI